MALSRLNPNRNNISGKVPDEVCARVAPESWLSTSLSSRSLMRDTADAERGS